MPVRLRRVLFARFSASPTASCHPFGEDPIIVVTRATAIAHLLISVVRLGRSERWFEGSCGVWNGQECHDRASDGQSERRTDKVIEQRMIEQRGRLLRVAVGFAISPTPSYDLAASWLSA